MIDENSFKEEKNIIISMNGDNLNEINTMYTEFLKAPNTYKNIDKFMKFDDWWVQFEEIINLIDE